MTGTQGFDLASYLSERSRMVETALDRYLRSSSSRPSVVHEAMRYSVFGGGKRLRPVLVLAAAELAAGGQRALPATERWANAGSSTAVGPALPAIELALPVACAVEMIHTYSLIHDDLPCMDDDDYRRGRLTSHKVFGEAQALLAGDALLTQAFELLAAAPQDCGVKAEVALGIIDELARASGSLGMIGGQVEDLLAEGTEPNREKLEFIHRHKTGALFRACLRVGGLVGGASAEGLDALERYAADFGLAFQIMDDVLDVVGDEAKLGKKVGSDEKNRKATYPSIFGLEESVGLAHQAVARAVAALQPFEERAAALRALAFYVVNRDH